eukprot:scaffold1790_cov257-Pinguiococcus_pyrenoidosus.AAC.21
MKSVGHLHRRSWCGGGGCWHHSAARNGSRSDVSRASQARQSSESRPGPWASAGRNQASGSSGSLQAFEEVAGVVYRFSSGNPPRSQNKLLGKIFYGSRGRSP